MTRKFGPKQQVSALVSISLLAIEFASGSLKCTFVHEIRLLLRTALIEWWESPAYCQSVCHWLRQLACSWQPPNIVLPLMQVDTWLSWDINPTTTCCGTLPPTEFWAYCNCAQSYCISLLGLVAWPPPLFLDCPPFQFLFAALLFLIFVLSSSVNLAKRWAGKLKDGWYSINCPSFNCTHSLLGWRRVPRPCPLRPCHPCLILHGYHFCLFPFLPCRGDW